MTTEYESSDRLPAIVEYLKMHPTEKLPGAETTTGPGATQIIHVHEHHHYAPPAPPPPPPKATLAEQLPALLCTALLATIILTICAVILAAVIVALVVGLIAVALCAAVISHLIKTTRESQINMELTRERPAPRRKR
jgi:Flp pilus assembly protein TadB